MEVTTLLAREKGIDVNTVVIKEIPINTPKDMIVATVFKFGEIKSIKIQLIEMWQKTVVEFAELGQANSLVSKWLFLIGKNSVQVAKAVKECKTWASRDQFRVLLFILLVGTMAHDFGTLLNRAGGKTCIINRSLETGNRIRCAARMDLVQYEKCGKFGHSALECNASVASPFKLLRTFKRLAKLYEKKSVSISHPTAFGSKSWTQVVSLAGPFGGLCFSSGSSSSALLSNVSDLDSSSFLASANDFSLNTHLATLKCSLELLMDQVSGILKKLGDMELVPKATSSDVFSLATPTSLVPLLDIDMVLKYKMLASAPHLSTANNVVHGSGLSLSKVLTSKVGRLESKMVAFEVSIGLVLEKLDHLGLVWKVAMCNVRDFNSKNMVSIITETKLKSSSKFWITNKFEGVHVFMSGLNRGFLDAGVAVIMNNSLACKLSVTILDLYAGVSFGTRFA
ncbi:hypothetical protein G9A89_004373 [Geosiphon pyriformis]|nr:hypothetical protein G9A89_004373 [Geosiphon pyriformis]